MEGWWKVPPMPIVIMMGGRAFQPSPLEMRYESIIFDAFPFSGVIRESIVTICELRESYCK